MKNTAPNRPGPELRTFDVSEFKRVTGVGKSLARIQAPSMAAATEIATQRFGLEILVSPAGGRRRPRQDRRRA